MDPAYGGVLLNSKRPKRKRGFHRAVKRGETWATFEFQMKEIMNKLRRSFYEGLIYEPDPFMKLLRENDKDV